MTRIWGFGGFDLCPDQCVQLGKGSEDSYHELMKAMALTAVLDAGHEPMGPPGGGSGHQPRHARLHRRIRQQTLG